jgi:RNA polymerase sigma-70 factor (ECF subfamily)
MKKVAREMVAKKNAVRRAVTIENNDPSGYIAFREKELLLEKAIKQLSPQQQLVYKLSREQGLPNKDIAIRLHISNKTVKNHLTNGMRIIRKYFSLNMYETNS